MSDENKIVAVVAGIESLKKSVEASMSAGINEMKTESSRLKSIKDDVATAVREIKEAAKSGVYSIDKRHESYEELQKKLVTSKQALIIGALIIGVCIICGICLKVWANSFKTDIDQEKAAITMLLEQRTKLQNEVRELQKTQANLGTFGATQTKLKDGRTGLAFPQNYNKIDLSDGSIFIYKK
jgi:outer membrane murein-binding lipoprotein Lpp